MDYFGKEISGEGEESWGRSAVNVSTILIGLRTLNVLH